MSVQPGEIVELDVEKPASGGRMIARHEGQVVLVLGAIPGERVRARIERADKRLAFASTLEPVAASPDRRPSAGDPRCGGCVFSHITYARQVALKSEIIADAFTRLARLPPGGPVPVAESPEQGYRMRARFHVRGDRAGFYREGTHELCDAAGTGQLLPDAIAAVEAAIAAIGDAGVTPAALELSENIAGDQRAVHVEVADGGGDLEAALDAAVDAASLRGATARTGDGRLIVSGEAAVSDSLAVLTGGRAAHGVLSRSPDVFFQANRYLLPRLVTTVLDRVPVEGDLVDLYAGVGLFSIALGACGRDRITAVESDRASGADLKRNAIPWFAVTPFVGRVEDYLIRRRGAPAQTVIVDPPRTGISKEAMEGIARHGAARVIYVSCDPPTMARDARRLVDAGYRLDSLEGFDLFPNTPHVETVGVFTHS